MNHKSEKRGQNMCVIFVIGTYIESTNDKNRLLVKMFQEPGRQTKWSHRQRQRLCVVLCACMSPALASSACNLFALIFRYNILALTLPFMQANNTKLNHCEKNVIHMNWIWSRMSWYDNNFYRMRFINYEWTLIERTIEQVPEENNW